MTCKAREALKTLGFHSPKECPARLHGGYPGCSACSDALAAHDCVPREVAEAVAVRLRERSMGIHEWWKEVGGHDGEWSDCQEYPCLADRAALATLTEALKEDK